MNPAPEPRYWIVGSLGHDHRDHFERFIAGRYWQPAPRDRARPGPGERLAAMRAGDHIAIRYRPGHQAPHIIVRALGVIEGDPQYDGRVPVRWLRHDLRRIIPTERCRRPVEGPLAADDPLVAAVFFPL